MTVLSLSLITTWMTLLVLGVTLAGFVHLFLLAGAAVVFLGGHRLSPASPARPE
jgi:hypothetical protein